MEGGVEGGVEGGRCGFGWWTGGEWKISGMKRMRACVYVCVFSSPLLHHSLASIIHPGHHSLASMPLRECTPALFSYIVLTPILSPMHASSHTHAFTQGVTMLATLDSRRLALEIAGKWRDEEAWAEAVREVRAKVSAAEQTQRAQVCVCVCERERECVCV